MMDNEREDEMKGQDKKGREDRKEKGEIGGKHRKSKRMEK